MHDTFLSQDDIYIQQKANRSNMHNYSIHLYVSFNNLQFHLLMSTWLQMYMYALILSEILLGLMISLTPSPNLHNYNSRLEIEPHRRSLVAVKIVFPCFSLVPVCSFSILLIMYSNWICIFYSNVVIILFWFCVHFRLSSLESLMLMHRSAHWI